jgi:hypothetical protein
MLTHHQYTHLLSKRMRQGSLSEVEMTQLTEFTQDQPTACPKCGCQVFSPFLPDRGLVVHDIAGCKGKKSK